MGRPRTTVELGNRCLFRLNTFSPAVEAYRRLRTNLKFLSVDHPLREIIVTSATAAEGKTLTAGNLGIILQQGGPSVAIVDCDMRRPALHHFFGNQTNRPGLSDVLTQTKTLDQALREVAGDVWILPSGEIPPNPSELLGSQQMERLRELLTSRFDLVIYDTPPILAASDAVVLAGNGGATLLVVRAGKVDRRSTVAAKDALERVGARILGVVLDGVETSDDSYYSYASRPVR